MVSRIFWVIFATPTSWSGTVITEFTATIAKKPRTKPGTRATRFVPLLASTKDQTQHRQYPGQADHPGEFDDDRHLQGIRSHRCGGCHDLGDLVNARPRPGSGHLRAQPPEGAEEGHQGNHDGAE